MEWAIRDCRGSDEALFCLLSDQEIAEWRASPNRLDWSGANALMLALAHGRASLAQRLEPLFDAKEATPKGLTALMAAAEAGDAKAVARLLPASDAGACDCERKTAAHRAAEKGHDAILGLLLPFSDPAAKDHIGRDALTFAIASGSLACVDLLAKEPAEWVRALDIAKMIENNLFIMQRDDCFRSRIGKSRAILDFLELRMECPVGAGNAPATGQDRAAGLSAAESGAAAPGWGSAASSGQARRRVRSL